MSIKNTEPVQAETHDEASAQQQATASTAAAIDATAATDNQPSLHKSLKNRHIQLIALGGAIGTGLFTGRANRSALRGRVFCLRT